MPARQFAVCHSRCPLQWSSGNPGEDQPPPPPRAGRAGGGQGSRLDGKRKKLNFQQTCSRGPKRISFFFLNVFLFHCPPPSPSATRTTNKTSAFPGISCSRPDITVLGYPSHLERDTEGGCPLYIFIFSSAVLGKGSGLRDHIERVWGRKLGCAGKCSIISSSASPSFSPPHPPPPALPRPAPPLNPMPLAARPSKEGLAMVWVPSAPTPVVPKLPNLEFRTLPVPGAVSAIRYHTSQLFPDVPSQEILSFMG
uniref:uncharacterized protein LOC132681374 n=1 Tax=Panthera onca TaxID=9690 RepID=UPI002954E9DC|nr:uncharacterized protein LOC132681374 [Panthera onca]